MLAELASRELRGVSFDLPGLGLAERPSSFDYTWTNLGRFCAAAVDELGLNRFHLVVHDIGGPVGFELAAARRDRIASLTILNTMIAVDTFKRPWAMQPFARRRIGEMYLRAVSKPVFRLLMRQIGVADMSCISPEEIDAYVDLLKREDGGRAFLKIMRGCEHTPQKRELYHSTVRDVPYPLQVVWGELDSALNIDLEGEQLRRAAGLQTIHRLPAKHFLQEDRASAIAERIAALT
ncbi:MAG: alpha/beta fold hydrolase [Solirubrobacteraceae bacterium]